MLTRREFAKSALGGACAALPAKAQLNISGRADYTVEIGTHSLELSPRTTIKTLCYNGEAPGPLIRLQSGKLVTIDVVNQSSNDEVVHWHGLFLPSNIDGATEEGTPLIGRGGRARYTFTPDPAGFRWYHTHTFAGHDLNKGQYTGQHGFLYIDPRENAGRYDAEVFLGLHDWRGQLLAADDGSMNPFYDVSTINGRVLGFGEPLRVKQGQRVLLHILNSSATDAHWVALTGHHFEVVALDGNAVPSPKSVTMLRLAPAERVSAIVEMNNPGVWVLGEVRKHIRAAGMGIVIEYAEKNGEPQWQQPETLVWDYAQFAAAPVAPAANGEAVELPLVFRSKFTGHGDMDHWTINGKSYPHTDKLILKQGQRYRLLFKNESSDDHPVHLHRHLFELCELPGERSTRGILKDTVLVPANQQVNVEFVANNPGATLFHCHQQDHMDMGFMMLFQYA